MRAVPYTVPEPFKLHDASTSERLEKLQNEVEQQRMSECTFHPKTNEASLKAVLQSALRRERCA